MNTDRDNDQKTSWLNRLSRVFSSRPTNTDDISMMLRDAHDNKILDNEAFEIMEGALTVAQQQVREIMIPRSRMTVVPLDANLEQIMAVVIESKHSRFPVIGDSIDDIKGILLAKDLLPLAIADRENFDLAQVIRPATIVPESKRLNILLKEFREQRYHMAMVLDEYASVAGLVTIEDILEEIVGEIEDETDQEESYEPSRQQDGSFQIAALMPIDEFNEYFDTGLSEAEFDTIGGIVTQTFGHFPATGEITVLDNFQFEVLAGDERRIHLLAMRVIAPPSS